MTTHTFGFFAAFGMSLLLVSVLSTDAAAEGAKLKQLANKELAHGAGHRNRGGQHRGRDRDRHRHRPERGHRGRDHGHHRRHKPGGWYYVPPRRGHHRRHHPHNYRAHLPFGFARLLIHGLEYFYHSGRFYRPYSEGFVVVTAPHGAVVATLPYGYNLVNVNGRQYYVVNDTYYVTHPQGYQVVSRPPDVTNTAPIIHPNQPSNQLYIYPQQGQTAEQQARDEYECHRWGVEQTGFDPSQSNGIGNSSLQQNYQRAMSACLEARGYTVK